MTSKEIKGKTGRFASPLSTGSTFSVKRKDGSEVSYGGIEGLLGAGGFAAVYRIKLDEKCVWRPMLRSPYAAAKVLTSDQPDDILRFEREGEIGVEILGSREGERRLESLLSVVESGEMIVKQVEGGEVRKYILMECFEDAENMRKYVKHDPSPEGPKLMSELPFEEAVDVISVLVDTIDYAHRRGIANRDIKPDNILRSKKTKKIKIIDWGIGWISDSTVKEIYGDVTREIITQSRNTIVGSPHYASPEAATKKLHKYPKEIDVWGIGATAYALMCGVSPYTGPTGTDDEIFAIYGDIKSGQGEDVPFLKKRNHKVPWPINDYVMGCLQPLDKRIGPEFIKSEWEAALKSSGCKK